MNGFIYHSPTKFIFSRGCAASVGEEFSKAAYKKVLLVYGGGSVAKSGLLDKVRASLISAGIGFVEMSGVRPNPEVSLVREGIQIVRSACCDSVLALGGGSVIDCAKAVSFGACYDGDVWDFFDFKAKITKALPVSVVLTIPAAGSEGSASCVISNDKVPAKRGVSSEAIRPKVAFLDPEATFSLSKFQTASGVTDMIAHICERYFSGQGPAPITDSIATSIIKVLLQAAPVAIAKPDSYEARASIMWAGTLAHNDLCGCGRSASPDVRAGGWESHALEHELSAVDPKITHGAGLAVVMPAWMRYVWRTDPSRFLSFGRDVFGIEPEDASEKSKVDAVMKTIDSLQAFFRSIGMPSSLKSFGLDEDVLDRLLNGLEKSRGSSFGAFQKLSREDARHIYLDAFKSVDSYEVK